MAEQPEHDEKTIVLWRPYSPRNDNEDTVHWSCRPRFGSLGNVGSGHIQGILSALVEAHRAGYSIQCDGEHIKPGVMHISESVRRTINEALRQSANSE